MIAFQKYIALYVQSDGALPKVLFLSLLLSGFGVITGVREDTMEASVSKKREVKTNPVLCSKFAKQYEPVYYCWLEDPCVEDIVEAPRFLYSTTCGSDDDCEPLPAEHTECKEWRKEDGIQDCSTYGPLPTCCKHKTCNQDQTCIDIAPSAAFCRTITPPPPPVLATPPESANTSSTDAWPPLRILPPRPPPPPPPPAPPPFRPQTETKPSTSPKAMSPPVGAMPTTPRTSPSILFPPPSSPPPQPAEVPKLATNTSSPSPDKGSANLTFPALPSRSPRSSPSPQPSPKETQKLAPSPPENVTQETRKASPSLVPSSKSSTSQPTWFTAAIFILVSGVLLVVVGKMMDRENRKSNRDNALGHEEEDVIAVDDDYWRSIQYQSYGCHRPLSRQFSQTRERTGEFV